MFTKEQILEIQNKLRLNSIRDTEMENASLPITGSEEISFVQNGRNVKMNMTTLLNNLLLFRASDILNLSESFDTHFTLEEAMMYVAPVNRKVGLVITYIDRTIQDWVIFQFKGKSQSEWMNVNCWKSLLDENRFKGYFENETHLEAVHPSPNIGDHAFVGQTYGSSFIYKCTMTGVWTETQEYAYKYTKIVVEGNVTIGNNGNWFQDGIDTGLKAEGPQGDRPYLRLNPATGDLEYTYDFIYWQVLINKLDISGESASIAIGTVSAVKGASPTITNIGDEHHAILDIILPDVNTMAIDQVIEVPYYENTKVENVGTPYDMKLKFTLKQGPPGSKGSKGDKGDGYYIKGFRPYENTLPTTGNVLGDAYIVGMENPYTLYMYNGNSFLNIGELNEVKSGVFDGGYAGSKYGGARTIDCGTSD